MSEPESSPQSVNESTEYPQYEPSALPSPRSRSGVSIPSFVANLKERPSFEESIRIAQLPESWMDDNGDEAMTPRASKDDSMAAIPPTYIVTHISHRATQRSLNDHLSDSKYSILLPACRVLSLMDNMQGSLGNIKVGDLVTVVSFGILVPKSHAETKSLIGEHLYAYGEAGRIEVMDPLGWKLLDAVFGFFYSKHFTPKSVDQNADGPKFGGGLSRRSGVSTRGRYTIRGKTDDLDSVTEDEWKRRGAYSVEQSNSGALTVIRFAKNETRNAACDSFILLVEIGPDHREIGLSQVNSRTVLIENYKDEIEEIPDFLPLSLIPSSMPTPRPR